MADAASTIKFAYDVTWVVARYLHQCVLALAAAGMDNLWTHTHFTFPTLGRVTFCKRWHMGHTYFRDCSRKASHVHLSVAMVDTILAAMAEDQSARGAVA